MCWSWAHATHRWAGRVVRVPNHRAVPAREEKAHGRSRPSRPRRLWAHRPASVEAVIVAARFIAERLGQVRSFNAWYRIGDLRPGIEASLFPPVVAEPDARRREAAAKADRRRYRLATHGAHVFDTVRFLLGEVASVAARHRQDGPDHVGQALLTTTSGAVGTVTIAADVPGLPSEGIEVFGAAGAVRR